jgi:hypothetical protein
LLNNPHEWQIPIGFLDWTELFLSVEYAQYEATSKGSKEEYIIPFLHTGSKDWSWGVHWFDQKGTYFKTAANPYTPYEIEQVKKILLLLYKVANLKKPPIEGKI